MTSPVMKDKAARRGTSPVQWTVVAIALGGGADGEGEHPPPVSTMMRECFPHPKTSGLLKLLPFGQSFPAPRGGSSAWR